MVAQPLTLGIAVAGALVIGGAGALQERSCSDVPDLPDRRFIVPDEGATDPSFAAFRQQLAAAADACDVPRILTLVDKDVDLPNDTKGLTAFEHFFALDSYGRDEFCQRMRHAATLPAEGSSSEGFCAPYVNCPSIKFRFTEGFDVFDAVVIVGDHVPVRQRPDRSAAVVAMLSYHLVEQWPVCPPLWPSGHGWVLIAGAHGLLGYVEEAHVVRVSGSHVFFSRRDGQWRLTAISGEL